MARLVEAGLRDHAGQARVAREVRSHGRARTDILLLQDGELTGVEVKLSDWRRAVAQAVLNRYCFDRSYIALWCSRITDQILSEARRHGVGVISVDNDAVAVVSHAPKTQPVLSLRGDIVSRAFGEVD